MRDLDLSVAITAICATEAENASTGGDILSTAVYARVAALAVAKAHEASERTRKAADLAAYAWDCAKDRAWVAAGCYESGYIPPVAAQERYEQAARDHARDYRLCEQARASGRQAVASLKAAREHEYATEGAAILRDILYLESDVDAAKKLYDQALNDWLEGCCGDTADVQAARSLYGEAIRERDGSPEYKLWRRIITDTWMSLENAISQEWRPA